MTPEWVSASAAVASVFVTIGAVLFARAQIASGRRNTTDQIRDTQARERRERVDQYLARLNHVDYLPLVADAADLLKTPPLGQQEALSRWLGGSSEDRLRTLAFLNFFEEVAGQYNAGMLDRDAANRALVPVAEHYWEAGEWFIGRLRAQQPSAFTEWQEMMNRRRLAELTRDETG